MSRMVLIVQLGAAALLACGCGDGETKTAERVPLPSPALAIGGSPQASADADLPSPPAPGAPVRAHLTIRGVVQDQVYTVQSQGSCGRGAEGYGAQLTFPLRGRPYVLSLQVFNYQGPGQYTIPPERVSMHTQTTSAGPTLAAAVSGTVVVNSDERSGSIDVAMSDSFHVSGTWACSP
jgi:hypothetical protein